MTLRNIGKRADRNRRFHNFTRNTSSQRFVLASIVNDNNIIRVFIDRTLNAPSVLRRDSVLHLLHDMQVQYSVLFCLLVTAIKGQQRNQTVVLSVGALNLNYLEHMPTLREYLTKYTSAKYMMPVMPTKGTVNHMSIATGLFADGHGVIDDCEYDEPKDKCVYGKPDLKKTPIWIENELKGGTSAVMDWPGAEYTKNQLTYYRNFNEQNYYGVNYKRESLQNPQALIGQRIDQIIKWVTDKNKPANLVMVYYEELDKALHKNSDNSNKILAELFYVEYFIKNLIYFMNENAPNVNLIFLGSHGGMPVNGTGGIDLNDILKDINACYVKGMGGNALVTPKYRDRLKDVHKILEEHAKTTDGKIKYFIYYQHEIPEIWHLKTMPLFKNKIFLVANKGYFFWNQYLTKNAEMMDVEKINATVDGYWGYTEDDQTPLNHTFFMAKGPEFVPEIQVPPFNTTDVYQLLRKLLEFSENEKLSDTMKELFEPTEISVRLVPPVVKELFEPTDISATIETPEVKELSGQTDISVSEDTTDVKNKNNCLIKKFKSFIEKKVDKISN